jgi:hypothetical protein
MSRRSMCPIPSLRLCKLPLFLAHNVSQNFLINIDEFTLTMMQFLLLLFRKDVDIVWIVHWIWQIIFIIQLRQFCFCTKLSGQAFKSPYS